MFAVRRLRSLSGSASFTVSLPSCPACALTSVTSRSLSLFLSLHPLPSNVIFSRHRLDLVPIKGGDHPRPAARYTACSRRCTLITYSVASISVPWILCHYAISRRMQRVAVSCASRGCTLRRRCTIRRYPPRDVVARYLGLVLRVCHNASELRRLWAGEYL